MHCRKKLRWYENIPIFSWVFLGGKCSKCGKKIGVAEILAEFGMGVAFVMTYFGFKNSLCGVGGEQLFENDVLGICGTVPLDYAVFGMILLFVLIAGFLAIYDGLYGELPSLCLTFLAICAIIIAILKQWSLVLVGQWTPESLGGVMGAVMVLGGVYLLLYAISRGKWVGDGDWILAGAIGLVLGSAWLALVALCVANLVACLVMLPTVIKNKKHTIYFGPFLVIAFVVVFAFAEMLKSLI